MTPIDAHLDDLARASGITIQYAKLRDGHDGEYIHARRLIRLRPGMHARLHRSVLAHELAHAAFGDVPTRFGPVHAKQERRAEEWAALRLITIADYRHAEELHSGHLGAIAIELGVMMTIVRAFRSLLERHGDTVYVGGRMGAGQWTQRVQVT